MPRKRAPRCKVRGCKGIARISEWCKKHALREADKRFSERIRQYGGCYAKTEFWQGPEFACAGPLQCAHLISRRYRNTRWHRDNAIALCAAHHRWFDTNPLEREEMIRGWLGSDYEPLRKAAMAHGDWEAILREYLEPGAAMAT